MDRAGERVAALVYDRSLDDDPELVEAVGGAAAIACENRLLQAQADARLAELQASRQRLVTAADAERRRIERNLHDGAQQRLVTLALQLALIRRRIHDGHDAEALVATASDELAASLAELRELARGIHPAALEQGLDTAIEGLVLWSTVPARLVAEPRDRLPRHVEFADDGIGGADPSAGSGLSGLADRVEALGGRLRVASPPYGGTVVTAELPWEPRRRRA